MSGITVTMIIYYPPKVNMRDKTYSWGSNDAIGITCNKIINESKDIRRVLHGKHLVPSDHDYAWMNGSMKRKQMPTTTL